MPTVRRILCKVQKIEKVTPGVYILTLKPDRPLPRFLPGQFCHLAIDAYDPSFPWPESRAFSIASSPARRDQLVLAYSVIGAYTKRMEQELREGRDVWVKLPYGDFIIPLHEVVVLWAGGSGVSAFTAFISSEDSQGEFVEMVYGVRSFKHALFWDVVGNAKDKGMGVHMFIEDSATNCPLKDGVNIFEGKISPQHVWHELRNPLLAVHFLSGPPDMLTCLKTKLMSLGVKNEKILIDDWD